jgi:hypothetical protein
MEEGDIERKQGQSKQGSSKEGVERAGWGAVLSAFMRYEDQERRNCVAG